MNMMTELKDVRHGHVLREKMRVAGEHVGGERTIDVVNPYTGAIVGTVPKATPDEVARAFAIAKAYRPQLTRYDRYRILHRGAELIRGRAEEISDLITAESGLCKKDSLYEVGRACDVFVFAGNAALADDGQVFSCDLTPHGKETQGLHAARAAARRDLGDHAVQPPAEPGRAQGRAVDRDQQPDGAEAHRKDAALRAAPRRHPVRGRLAAADVLGGHRRPERDRRRDADRREHRSRHLHRRRGGRQVDRGEGRLQAASAGNGRQRSADRDGGRRSRGSRVARGCGLVQELGPALHGGQAHARARGGCGAVRRAAARKDEGLALRRSDGSGAGHGHGDRRGRRAIVRGESRRRG